MSTSPRLVVIAGSQQGSEWALGPGVTSIGRGDDCTITLDDHGASRRHAEIAWQGDALDLRDLGSTNRTRVNGEVVEACDLKHGDQIQIGDTGLRVEWRPEAAVVPRDKPGTGARSSGGGRVLIAILAVVVVVVGAFMILAAGPAPPPSSRDLQAAREQRREADDARAQEQVAELATQRGAPPSAASIALYEQARTLAFYNRLQEARTLLRRVLQISPGYGEAAALLEDCESRIDKRIDELMHRARTASATLQNDRVVRLLEEVAALADREDPRRVEAEEFMRQLAAKDR